MITLNPMVLFAGTPLYTLYLRALGAKIGRGVADPDPASADLHRPADHRRRHGHPQAHLLQRLPRPGRAGSRPARSRSAATCSSARRRCSTSTRHRRRSPARPRLVAARGAGRARRRALARLPRRSRPRSDYRTGRTGRLRHPAPGRLHRRCSWCCWFLRLRAARAGGLALLLDRGPGAGRAAGPGRTALTSGDVLRRRAGRHRSCCSSASSLAEPRSVAVTVPRVLNRVAPARAGLPAVRPALLGVTG